MTSHLGDKPLFRIHIGGLHVSREPVIIQTLLGSCVSVCLFDPVAEVGGMNHIFLPGNPTLGRDDGSTRFGLNAMEQLIRGVLDLGAERSRLAARVFGGAHILQSIPPAEATGAKNIKFVDGYLEQERIPLLEQDVGGTDTRVLQFHTDSGVVDLRRVPASDVRKLLDAEARLRRRIVAELQLDDDETPHT